MRRPFEGTVAFTGRRQDANFTNALTKAGPESQVIAERNIHLGELWLVQPYTGGAMEPTQNSFRSRREVVKDFLTFGVEVFAPRQWYARSRFRVYLNRIHRLLPSMRQLGPPAKQYISTAESGDTLVIGFLHSPFDVRAVRSAASLGSCCGNMCKTDGETGQLR